MERKPLPAELLAFPTVFALRDTYQIFIPFTCEAIVWARERGIVGSEPQRARRPKKRS